MANIGAFPNVMHGDKWRINFSNIPVLSDVSDMKYFDNYVKACVIPNYSVGEIISYGFGIQTRHPLGGMKKNHDLGDLSITFKISEDLYNYIVMFRWIQELRYGQIDPKYVGYFHDYVIKKLNISMLDNQKRVVSYLEFTKLQIKDISSLDLVFGTTDELTFTAIFGFDEVFYKIENPMVGGTKLDTPLNLNECGTSGVSNTPTVNWEK